MKKIFASGIIAASIVLGGCATSRPLGSFYTELDLPVTATSNATATKTGTATCQSVLSLVATGDCSIETAKANGGINKVTHVDWHARNILGIFGTYTLTVYGN